jgi:hypothetical protein
MGPSFSIYESKEARAAIKRGHEEACRQLDRRAVASIPESDPNHPKFSVAA